MSLVLSNQVGDIVVVLNKGTALEQPGLRLASGPWQNAPQLNFADGTKAPFTLSADRVYADVVIPVDVVNRLVDLHHYQGGLGVALVDPGTGRAYAAGHVELGEEVPA